MDSKELINIFANELKPSMSKYGFKQTEIDQFMAIRDFGFDMVGFGFTSYGEDYYANLIVRRRYDKIETIVGPLIKLIHLNYRNDGSDETLRFDENNLDGKESGSKRYTILNNHYIKSLEDVKYTIINRFIPFLNSIETLDKLHDFINVPPYTLMPKSSFFYLGSALFRKMVIAKLARRDYNDVSGFVYNLINNELRVKNKEEFNKYKKVYEQLKKKLDFVN
jgi:hypothetical protein